jgi:dienelactone hydrolase
MTSTSGYRSLRGLLFLATLCCGCTGQPVPSQFVGQSPTAASGAGEGGPDTPSGKVEKVVFPPLDAGKQIEPGIRFHEATLQRGGVPMKVWIYLPVKAAEKMPCVLVGPAGTHLIEGTKLGQGDQAEHLPYARAGFVVVAFEIDGAWTRDPPSDEEVIACARAFQNANAGLDNARTALDFALERIPSIDTGRVYCAGHSSAATLALVVARSEPRIKGCAAYAPATDVRRRVGREVVDGLNSAIPGYVFFLEWSSPSTLMEDLKCPVFLFQAKDDTNVRYGETRAFVWDIRKTNSKVTYLEVARGGHYQSMINEGIPKAIEWFQKLPK